MVSCRVDGPKMKSMHVLLLLIDCAPETSRELRLALRGIQRNPLVYRKFSVASSQGRRAVHE